MNGESIFEIPYYHDYISPKLAKELLSQAKVVPGASELKRLGGGTGLESQEAMKFLADLYKNVRSELKKVLDNRIADRKFIDERVRATYEFNKKLGRDILDKDYKTILGLEDANSRIVFGPLTNNYCNRGGKKIAPIPKYLQGPHVTLFGPPDSAKMAINAMNAYHRKLKDEPVEVSEILKNFSASPMWGADDEDSKTPLHNDLIDSAVNLTGCFDGTLSLADLSSGKKYELAKNHLATPIKRFPGLALPCTFLFYNNSPVPLHLYDFALHLFKNWHNASSLAFYVPKLENEEEAHYIHHMIKTAEMMIQYLHPEYKLGSVRLMIVLENPRAIVRTHEIIDALYPYFVGASLGWHDYLGSMARLFKEDGNYRIPVKADPDIVIKYIKASHLLLADVVGSRGGIKVGGMYGILPIDNDLMSPSFQMTILGFIKDVITQLKRDLTGYWVAHPDFVRIGLALVAGWQKFKKGNRKPLVNLVKALLHKKYHKEVIKLITSPDIKGLDKKDPNYVRSLIVADIKESDFIPNNDPEEIRYNVFQSLQYITDWLTGNGCVALPAIVRGVPVRVMDDLATAERSRWEVWHEIYHGRFSVEDFIRIAFEELAFIRKDLSNKKKIVQVKWDDKTAKWYPVAMKLMIQLMTNPKPVEFATELLMPFTTDVIRSATDPYASAYKSAPDKYKFTEYVERLFYYYEVCGSMRFAKTMAQKGVHDEKSARDLILSFSKAEVNEAAFFHGNIGESKKTLDRSAALEQAQVHADSELVQEELRALGGKYLKKFGFKFLISAKGKSGRELLEQLKVRMENPAKVELDNAKIALWEISLKRMQSHAVDNVAEIVEKLRIENKVHSISIAINTPHGTQAMSFGGAKESTWFQMASLSKTMATSFAIEYFDKKNIRLDTCVNELLKRYKSKFKLEGKDADKVTIRHLMSHSALNNHYVRGWPSAHKRPQMLQLLMGLESLGYQATQVINPPGEKFSYSGGGFLLLEHLIELIEKKSLEQITQKYFSRMNLHDMSFYPRHKNPQLAQGYSDSGDKISNGQLFFPAFAAGAMGTPQDMAVYLQQLTLAYNSTIGTKGMSHDTAVRMLHAFDRGSVEFMGVKCGLGVFVAEAGENRFAIHQGANDGFRALYLQCFSGPDKGKGFVICANTDNLGVEIIAKIAQALLQTMRFSGVDFNKFTDKANLDKIPQEQKVNIGYKQLVFSAFMPDLPDEIADRGPLDKLSEYNLCVGATITYVSNQKFARAENLISPHEPKFDPALFCRQGKVMDSWESARHNPDGSDRVLLKLKKPSRISFVSFSTKYHDGNQAEYVRLTALDARSKIWIEILPKTKLEGHSLLQVKLPEDQSVYSDLEVQMYPDGGLSRLGVFAELPQDISKLFLPVTEAKNIRFPEAIEKTKKPLTIAYKATANEVAKNIKRVVKSGQPMDLATSALGGRLVSASNEHYGPAAQVISPFPPIHMFDGLESARSRESGHSEEVTLQLGKKSKVRVIEMDFKYFVNNNPLEVIVYGLCGQQWIEIVERTNVKAFASLKKQFQIRSNKVFSSIKVQIYPDGGINRIAVY